MQMISVFLLGVCYILTVCDRLNICIAIWTGFVLLNGVSTRTMQPYKSANNLIFMK